MGKLMQLLRRMSGRRDSDLSGQVPKAGVAGANGVALAPTREDLSVKLVREIRSEAARKDKARKEYRARHEKRLKEAIR
jgi:hypothetical protein